MEYTNHHDETRPNGFNGNPIHIHIYAGSFRRIKYVHGKIEGYCKKIHTLIESSGEGNHAALFDGFTGVFYTEDDTKENFTEEMAGDNQEGKKSFAVFYAGTNGSNGMELCTESLFQYIPFEKKGRLCLHNFAGGAALQRFMDMGSEMPCLFSKEEENLNHFFKEPGRCTLQGYLDINKKEIEFIELSNKAKPPQRPQNPNKIIVPSLMCMKSGCVGSLLTKKYKFLEEVRDVREEFSGELADIERFELRPMGGINPDS